MRTALTTAAPTEDDESASPKRITFRLSAELQAQIDTYIARRQITDSKYSKNDCCLEALDSLTSEHSPITRYRDILAYARRELRELLTDEELWLILDACNGLSLLMEMTGGRHVSMQPGPSIALEVEDSILLNKADEQWNVKNGKGLVDRLRNLNVSQQYALVEMIERFWEDPQGIVSVSTLF